MQQRMTKNRGKRPVPPEKLDSFIWERDRRRGYSRFIVNGRTALIVFGVIALVYLLWRG